MLVLLLCLAACIVLLLLGYCVIFQFGFFIISRDCRQVFVVLNLYDCETLLAEEQLVIFPTWFSVLAYAAAHL